MLASRISTSFSFPKQVVTLLIMHLPCAKPRQPFSHRLSGRHQNTCLICASIYFSEARQLCPSPVSEEHARSVRSLIIPTASTLCMWQLIRSTAFAATDNIVKRPSFHYVRGLILCWSRATTPGLRHPMGLHPPPSRLEFHQRSSQSLGPILP